MSATYQVIHHEYSILDLWWALQKIDRETRFTVEHYFDKFFFVFSQIENSRTMSLPLLVKKSGLNQVFNPRPQVLPSNNNSHNSSGLRRRPTSLQPVRHNPVINQLQLLNKGSNNNNNNLSTNNNKNSNANFSCNNSNNKRCCTNNSNNRGRCNNNSNSKERCNNNSSNRGRCNNNSNNRELCSNNSSKERCNNSCINNNIRPRAELPLQVKNISKSTLK